MRILWPLVLALTLASGPASAAADGAQITADEIDALVDALKGRVLEAWQHDTLVELGEAIAADEDALPGDLIYAGWALVAADRPELGYPLVKRGLGMPPLLASDALRNVLLSDAFGQDDLTRSIIDLATSINPAAGKRLRNSVHLPLELEDAVKRARRPLKGLVYGTLEADDGDPRRLDRLVSWFVAPARLPERPVVIVLLPDSDRVDGLPDACQSPALLKEAAAWANDGIVAVLPGLRGCDLSEGLYLGLDDAADDLHRLVARLREDFDPNTIALRSEGVGGATVLALAGRDIGADRYIAVDPVDVRVFEHLPAERVAEYVAALELPAGRDDVVIEGEVDTTPRANRRRRK